jgi:hypothetical protein
MNACPQLSLTNAARLGVRYLWLRKSIMQSRQPDL